MGTSPTNESVLRAGPFEEGADYLLEVIRRGVPYLHKGNRGFPEDTLVAQLVQLIVKDIASSAQNLVVLKVDLDGEVRAGYKNGALGGFGEELSREETWEQAYKLAVHLIRNDPFAPENVDAKWCSHCSYRADSTNAVVSSAFGVSKWLHTARHGNCYDKVMQARRPLGELIPPHRRFNFL